MLSTPPSISTDPPDGTRTSALLDAWHDGDAAAGNAVAERAYSELRRLAGHYLRGERAGHTLQATELVNEAFARLWSDGPVDWNGRAHFVGRAAHIMRRVLVDHARARGRLKRGGERLRVTFEEPSDGRAEASPIDVLDLDAALAELAALDPAKARLVELRFFAGATIEETAETLGVSRSVAVRQWRLARAWLYRRLRNES